MSNFITIHSCLGKTHIGIGYIKKSLLTHKNKSAHKGAALLVANTLQQVHNTTRSHHSLFYSTAAIALICGKLFLRKGGLKEALDLMDGLWGLTRRTYNSIQTFRAAEKKQVWPLNQFYFVFFFYVALLQRLIHDPS